MENILVVGSGFSGAIVARKIAEEMNKKVTVIEKRSHIAGNMYDEYDKNGILIQKYGPHVLVTNEYSIIEYLSRFSEMYQHTVKELSFIDGQYIRLPYNFESIQQMLGFKKAEIVINKLRSQFNGIDRVPILDLCNSKIREIAEFGNMLFEKSFRTYCSKQWDVPTNQLDKSIMGRSAIVMGYDERYMNKDFQFLPKEGFTKMFEKMLKHTNIEVVTGCNALEYLSLDYEEGKVFYNGRIVDTLVYTGAIDELFNMKYGELPYRSLNIKYEWFDEDKIFPEKIISFPQADLYTRKTEYKYMMYDNSKTRGTVIATEYPVAYIRGGENDPFYPVITEETKQRYTLYFNEAKKFKSLFLCGRLAEFRYYNMDDCILNAFKIFERIKEKNNG